MRKKNSCCDYIRERNENLRREFLARLGKARSVLEIFDDIASNAPADRFYISEEQALKLLRLQARGRGQGAPAQAGPSLPTRARMLADISSRVDALLASDPSLSLRDAVETVVNYPAPSFYLTPASLCTLFYRAMRARRA